LSKASTISEASQRRFSRDADEDEGPGPTEGPPLVPQPCSTAMRRAGQSSRRAITPRAKRMRAGLDAGGDASAVAVEVDAIE
jgi:hypothetical protein